MMSTAALPSTVSAETTTPSQPVGPRIRVAVASVALYWIVYAAAMASGLAPFHQFLIRMGVLALGLLVVLGWWLSRKTVSWGGRFAVLGATALAFAVMMAFRHASIYDALLMSIFVRGVEIMLTGWVLWLLATQRSDWTMRQRGMIAIGALAWLWPLLVRMDGLKGDTGAAFYWRWTPSGEEKFLADASATKATPVDRDALTAPLAAAEGDWVEFRGPQRDGVVHGVKKLDWREAKPKELWRRRAGPGWSSIVVVGDRLFTQEQKGNDEATVCFDATTGDEVWSYVDKTRFDESMGGVGPRATPTFHEGRIYSLGATGILNCLDASTGELKWSKDVKLDGEEATPMWGFCSSPLVVDGRVIVFAGGGKEGEEPKEDSDEAKAAALDPAPIVRKTLVAYDADSGELDWRSPSGTHSYSSPMLAEFAGKQQVLFMSEQALESVDPETGKRLWELESNSKQGSPCIQPHLLGDDQLLASFTTDGGVIRARVKHDNGAWSTEVEWVSRDIKPFFSDFVRHDGNLYGFDGSVFCCVDAETGKRHWKQGRQGRYGSGQMLLLADQPVLFVITEAGEAVLVAANPEKLEELGKFQAIEGKTWNHPTIVGDRLYVRNAEEMACYEL
jgi:outer membrane protein assembly factor BamB